MQIARQNNAWFISAKYMAFSAGRIHLKLPLPLPFRLNKAIDYLNTDGGEGINQDLPVVDVTPISPESFDKVAELYGTSSDASAMWNWICTTIAKRAITGFEDLTEAEAQKIIAAIKGAK